MSTSTQLPQPKKRLTARAKKILIACIVGIFILTGFTTYHYVMYPTSMQIITHANPGGRPPIMSRNLYYSPLIGTIHDRLAADLSAGALGSAPVNLQEQCPQCISYAEVEFHYVGNRIDHVIIYVVSLHDGMTAQHSHVSSATLDLIQQALYVKDVPFVVINE